MADVTPEQLAYIIGAAVLVVCLQTAWAWREPITEWARRMLASVPALPRRDYVKVAPAQENVIVFSPRGKAEEENQAEAENGGKPSGANLTEWREQLKEEARARALGELLGAGLIIPDGRTRAMTALFGPAGRRHSRVRPWVDQAEAVARADNPPAAEEVDARLVPIHEGRGGYVEM